MVLVTPPAVDHAGEVWALAPGPTLIVCADADAALEWVAAAPADRRFHAVTSLSRSAAVLRSQPASSPPDVLAGTPQDLAALLARAALKLDPIRSIVLAWPELLLAGEQPAMLDTLLAELRDVPRIVLSWNPSALGDFLERHARRAEVVGALPVDADGRPLPPIGPARYVVIPPFRRPLAIADWRDAVEAKHPYVWGGGAIGGGERAAPCDAVLSTRLPTREEFRALAALGPVTLFASAGQLPYLRTLAAPLAPLSLPGAADRAQDRAEALRAQVASLLETGSVDAELMLLAPLFQQFEPAEVAAALLKMSRQPTAVSDQADMPPVPPGRVKIFVNIGKKDNVGPKDLVGALIREVGLDKSAIGKIEVRETFSVVEVAAGEVGQAMRGLTDGGV
ncbi:MAG: hypothetical protein DMD41_00540, partial [Gemmatimonadetes bacterium]